MIANKSNTRIFQMCFFACVLFFASCKKSSQTSEPDDKNWQKTESLTKIYKNSIKVDSLKINAQSNLSGPLFLITGTSYSITTGCAGNILNLTSIDYVAASPVPPSSITIVLNGFSFSSTSMYKGILKNGYYQLLNVPLSSIGISNFCLATSITVQYYAYGELKYSGTLQINEGVSCGSGSYQCSAYSPSKGKLSLSLPYLACGCANIYPPIYTFGYRLQGTTSWTNLPVSYPGYFTTNIISGLAAGVYEIQGQNTCNNWSAPPVPAVQSLVTVP